MIPSTLFNGLCSDMLQGELCPGTGGKNTTDGFANLLARLSGGGEGTKTNRHFQKLSFTGHRFLSELKKEFMASGRCMEKYTPGEDAMGEFGDILVRLGFCESEVEEMLSALSGRNTGNDATLAELFGAASQFTESDGGTSPSVMVDTSALPDLEIILLNLGLSRATCQRILSDALVEGSGIDLKALASGIRRELDSAEAPQDETILEADEFGELRRLLEGNDDTEGIPGSLLLFYLHQLTVPLGSAGRFLRWQVASAGKTIGGSEHLPFLKPSVQQMQETLPSSANIGTKGEADARAGTSDSGRMSLLRFVSFLESRIAAEESATGAANITAGQRPVAGLFEKFAEKVSSAAENAPQKQLVLSVGLEGKRHTRTTMPPGARSEGTANSRGVGKISAEVNPKGAAGQNTPQAFRQMASPGEGDRPLSGDPKGRELSERFSRILDSGSRNKMDKTADDTRFDMESVVRAMKSGGDGASPVKAAADRSLPGYLLNQVSRQILRLRNAGENEMTLQLKPPHLGRMKLTIEHTTGGMKVGIMVESAAAKDMLLAHTGDLKTALADQGLRLDRIEVENQAGFGQSMAQADRGLGQSGDQKGRWAGRSRGNMSGGSETAPELGPAVREVESGRLDLVA